MKIFLFAVVLLVATAVSAVDTDEIMAATGVLQSLEEVRKVRPILPSEALLAIQIQEAIAEWQASVPPAPPIPSDLTPELQATLESITP